MQRYELFSDFPPLEVLKLSFCPLFIPRLNSSFSRVFFCLSGFEPNISPIFFQSFHPPPLGEINQKRACGANFFWEYVFTLFNVCQYFFN